MRRIWNLRLNLDELNNLVGMAFTDLDRASMLSGLVLGCNGGVLPEQCSSSVRAAFEVGARWRAEASNYAEKKAEAGRKSAKVRSETFGTAQPNTNAKTPNSVQGMVSQTPNQSTIHNPITTKSPLPPKGKLPEDLKPRLEALVARWPGSFQKDGKTIRLPKVHTAEDLHERMVKFNRGGDLDLMIQAGEKHLQGVVGSDWDFGAPKGFTIAMCNFYGQQNRWKEFK